MQFIFFDRFEEGDLLVQLLLPMASQKRPDTAYEFAIIQKADIAFDPFSIQGKHKKLWKDAILIVSIAYFFLHFNIRQIMFFIISKVAQC